MFYRIPNLPPVQESAIAASDSSDETEMALSMAEADVGEGRDDGAEEADEEDTPHEAELWGLAMNEPIEMEDSLDDREEYERMEEEEYEQEMRDIEGN